MRYRELTLSLLAGGVLFAGCRYPKYAAYTSYNEDFRCQVPYSWQVTRDLQGTHYANATFLGPIDPAFLLGVPSFSVRWYSSFRPHTLPDGALEMYSGPDDFISQTLAAVYGPDYVLKQPVHEIELALAKIKAKHFIVMSAAPAPKSGRYGISEDAQTKERFNVRHHAYVLVPMSGGFYVLVYPATREGYAAYEKQFNHFVNTFLPLKHGPAGPPFSR